MLLLMSYCNPGWKEISEMGEEGGREGGRGRTHRLWLPIWV